MTFTLQADALTVEYDAVRGVNAVVLVPFPAPKDPDEKVMIVGTIEDLRGVVDSISGLLDDLEEDS